MQSPAEHFTTRSLRLAVLFACLMAGSFIVAKSFYVPEIFQLQFNPYGLLSLAATLLTLVLLVRMVLAKSHSEEAVWFMLVLFGDIFFAGGEAMQRFSSTASGAVFWSQVSGIGVPLIAIGLFLFAASYTKPPELRMGVLTPLLIAVSALISLFYVEGNMIFNNTPGAMKLYPWGLNSDIGPAFLLSIIWVTLLSVGAAVLLAHFRSKSHNQLLRKQSLLFLIAILIPIIGGITTDGLLPLLGIDVIPPMATVLEMATSIMLFYGISRYQFFQINPAILAENVLRTMNEAVVITRHDFSIEFINKEAERLLGVSGEKLGTSYIHSLFAPESWPKVHTYVADGLRTSSDLDDVEIMNHEGKRVPVRVFTSSMREADKFEAYIFVISDITDITESYNKLESDAARIRKLLEASHVLEKQLEEEKAGVEHTVEVRTRELREAQERLKAADQIKTEFIMLSSHNLRTPITTMVGSVQMLREERTPEERAIFLASLEQSITRLRDFVEDMVTITTIESGNGIIRQPVTSRELLEPLVAETKQMVLTKKALVFTAELDSGTALLSANLNWLQGAIRNILNNSFKFTEAGEIKLAARQTGKKLVITITDSGTGIKPSELPKLFTKFHRGTDVLTYDYEGEGIGLYLSKLIIAEHNGTITAESTLGKGSTFVVTLPIVASPAKRAQKA